MRANLPAKRTQQHAAKHHAANGSGGRRDAGRDDVTIQQVKERAAEVASYVKSSTRAATQQLKETAAEMARAVRETVKEEAERLFEEQRGKMSSKAAKVGKVVRQTAHALRAVRLEAVAEQVDAGAQRIDDASDYIKERNLTEVLQDAEEIVQRNRGLAVGGLFVAGFALARFLKASEPNSEGEGGEDQGDEDDE
jgi:hypothetical protein